MQHDAQTAFIDGDKFTRHHGVIAMLGDIGGLRTASLDHFRAFQIAGLGKTRFNVAGGQNSTGYALASQLLVNRLTEGIDEGFGGNNRPLDLDPE